MTCKAQKTEAIAMGGLLSRVLQLLDFRIHGADGFIAMGGLLSRVLQRMRAR
jgi:hypothetical protein